MLHKQPDNSNQTTRPKGHKDPENQVFYQKIPRKGFFSASYQLKHVGQKRSYARTSAISTWISSNNQNAS